MKEIDRWEEISKSIGSSKITDEPLQPNTNIEAHFEQSVSMVIKCKDELEKLKVELLEAINKAEKVIDLLDNLDYRLILKYKYINCFAKWEIAKIMSISISTLKRWQIEALRELEKIKS